MIPYSIHVAIILAVCLLFYKLLLQKETYYHLNRVVLLACLALAFTLPLIPVPQQFSFRSEPAVVNNDPAIDNSFDAPVNETNPAVFTARPENAVKQNNAKQQTIAAIAKAAVPVVPIMERVVKWAFWLYWFGVAAFGANLLLQVVVLLYQSYKKPGIQDGIYRIVELVGDKAPCSFGNSIFINPTKYDWDTYNQILIHEKVHIQQGHSFDLIVAELMLVMQWFNPFAWLYRKELESNLEFLTDDSVLHHHKVEPSEYQLSLLKVSVPNFSMRITTNYNQSLLKKRIIMMNAKRSNIHTMWKYFMLMPLLVVLVCGLNKPVAMSSPAAKFQQIFTHSNNSSDIDFSHGMWFATIKSDKINIEFKADENDEFHNWTSSHTFKLSDFPSLPKGDKADFILTREAGTVVFNGKFDGEQGYGHYKFTANKDYVAFMSKQNIEGLEEDEYFSFFMSDVKRDYVQFLKENGFKDLTRGQLMSMSALKVDAAYIKYWKKLGYNDMTPNELVSLKSLKVDSAYVNDIRRAGYTDLSVRQLISFKSQHITGDYINGLRKASVKLPGNQAAEKPTVQEIMSSHSMHIDSAYVSGIRNAGTSYADMEYRQLGTMKSMNITPEYIKSFEAVGYKDIPTSTLINMKSMEITPEYVKSFKDMGYTDADIPRLLQLKRQGVTPEYIKSFENAGYKAIPVNNLYRLKAQKITPEDVRGFQAVGYKELTLDNIASLKSQGITPEFIKGFQDVGYKDLPLNNFYTLKQLTPEYIKSFQDAGYKNISINQFSSLKRQGVTAEYVAGFSKLGFTDIPVNQLGYLKSSGITPEFVSEMKQKGFDSKDLNKYIQLKNFNSSASSSSFSFSSSATGAGQSTNH
ncbi:MAG TPA: M56 family metallopeptidase [Mucilaginibacter sp.]